MSLTRKDLHVEIKLIDGSILKGTLMVSRTERLSDMLNQQDKAFIVLSDYEDTHHIINKCHVIKIIEIESLELE